MKYLQKRIENYPSQLDTLRHQAAPAEPARTLECPALQAVTLSAPQSTAAMPVAVTVIAGESAAGRWNAPPRTVH